MPNASPANADDANLTDAEIIDDEPTDYWETHQPITWDDFSAQNDRENWEMGNWGSPEDFAHVTKRPDADVAD